MRLLLATVNSAFLRVCFGFELGYLSGPGMFSLVSIFCSSLSVPQTGCTMSLCSLDFNKGTVLTPSLCRNDEAFPYTRVPELRNQDVLNSIVLDSSQDNAPM